MTYKKDFPTRLTKVDALMLDDHWYLSEGDICYFLGEYTAREGFSFSATNDLILNLKKGVDRRGRPGWRYKERAIRVAATAFRDALPQPPEMKALHSFRFHHLPQKTTLVMTTASSGCCKPFIQHHYWTLEN